MFKRPLDGPTNAVYWHILQTYSAAEIAFNRYVALFPRESWSLLWAKKPNESEKTVFLTGGRNIHFKSGHKLQDLRAETLHGAVIDECRQQKPELWSQIVRPMLGRHKGWCDFYSTPNGYDWVYDLYQAAIDNPEWDRFHSPSSEAWWWTPEEIESAKREMSEPVFAQEIMAEFRSLASGKVYYSFGDHNLTEDCPFMAGRQWSPYHPIYVGTDFNVNPISWVMGQFAYDKFWFFDSIHLNDSNSPEASRLLVDKIMIMRDQGFQATETEVIICGDASGNARSTKGNDSDYDIIKQTLKAAGIRYRDVTPDANPAIKDRINAVNSKLKSASDNIGVYIHKTNCKPLMHDLERVLWKNGADFQLDSGKDRQLTHASDAMGYVIHKLSPIKAVREIGKMQVLTRTL